jgi:cytochrome P450
MTVAPDSGGSEKPPEVSDIYLLTQMLPMDALLRMMGPEPQPVYAELLGKCPVLETAPGIMTVLGMKEVVELNRNRAVLGNGSLDRSMGGDRALIPLDLDGAEHTHFRKLLDKVFAPKRVALLEPAARATAGALLDTFASTGSVEAFSAFCQQLPSRVFLSIMGIPLTDLDYFLAFKDGILRQEMGEDLEVVGARRDEASRRCSDYFTTLYDSRAEQDDPGEDLLGWLMTAEQGGQRLSRDEFVNICLLLMIAGLDTVGASLSCMLSWLARHPDQRRWILEDGSRWPAAIEELLRYESPVPQGFRMATEDIELGGVRYPGGTRFCVSWPAANLDPEVFDDPLTVDLERSPNPHVDFASGWHRCLGSHLARMELRVALEEWHRRIPDYEVAPGTELVYLPLGVRQVMDLPLVWAPG